MPTRYSVVCTDDLAQEIERLARENEVTEAEVIRQLVDLGLKQLDEGAPTCG